MPRRYTLLLQQHGHAGMDLIQFQPQVLDRYRGDNGPWKLHWDENGHSNGITFFSWNRTGVNLQDYVDYITLIYMPVSEGKGPASGSVVAHLKDLAGLPEAEQEHWSRYERP